MAESLEQLIKTIQVVDESDEEVLLKLAGLVQLQAMVSGGEEEVINKLIDVALQSQETSMHRKIGRILMGFSSSKALNASRKLLLGANAKSGGSFGSKDA